MSTLVLYESAGPRQRGEVVLESEEGEPAPPILDLFLALVIKLGSAQAIAAAFAAAAATHRDLGLI
jgi:hypothetical protein